VFESLSIIDCRNGLNTNEPSLYTRTHNRYIRQYFYETATAAVKQAVIDCAATAKAQKGTNSTGEVVSTSKRSNRMLVSSEFPEMNPAMDSYRIGTVLEMARAMTSGLAEENLRVRLCVQACNGVWEPASLPVYRNSWRVSVN
jgi:adenylate kinase